MVGTSWVKYLLKQTNRKHVKMKTANFIFSIIMLLTIYFFACSSGKIIGNNIDSIKYKPASVIASKYPADHNIAADKSVTFSSSFENGFEGWTSFCDVCDIVNDDSLATQSKVLRITATKHLNTGGDVIFRFPKGEDEVYLRFYAWFLKTNVTPHHFVKIISYPVPYFGGQAGKKPGANKYFVLGIEPTKEDEWNFYNYWQGTHSWQI